MAHRRSIQNHHLETIIRGAPQWEKQIMKSFSFFD
jgi:hypothetical protein